jgi:lipopolysaccharide/colanic/teichoic acid biosynthesis glycosyltransferase
MIRHTQTAYSFAHFVVKRVADYLLVIPSLIFVIPASFLIALAIVLDSPGKPLFKQKRVGINGNIFEMYKFRSMYENVDQTLHIKHIDDYASGKLDISQGVKLKNDTRVTRVGNFIRKTSLDELPQLINVLNGTMTLVGPRPLPIYEVEHFNLWHNERLNVIPGMTGYWQVYGRSAVSFNDQLRYDIHYIKHMSIWLDVKLLFMTFYTVIRRNGAG